MHEAHCPGRELVSRRLDAEFVEFAIDIHETDIVITFCAFFERGCDFTKALPNLGTRAPRSAPCDQSLDDPPDLQEPELAIDVDLGNHDPSTWQDHDEPLSRQSVQCLPDWRASDSKLLGQLVFRHRAPRPKAQSHDHLFEIEIRLVGQRLRAACDAPGPTIRDLATHQCCLRFSTSDRNFSYSRSSTS